MNQKMLGMLAWWLLVVGGLNWGLVGLLHFNVVEMVLGMGMLSSVVYVLVGLAAVYSLVTMSKMKK